MSQLHTQTKDSFTFSFIVPPGEVLEEKINEMGLGLEEFAERASLSPEVLIQLLKGRLSLTQTIAEKLERTTKIPADYWNRAEMFYREKLAKLGE